MKHVIRWTTNERHTLITATVKLMQTGNYDLLDAFRQAQNTVIPSDRQRKLTTLQILGDLPKLVKQELNKCESTIEPVTQEPTPATLETLIQTIAQYVAQTVKTEIVKVVYELEHEFKVKKHNPEYAGEKAYGQRSKIVVIGLLPHQEHSISLEFPQYAFHFMATEYAMHAKPTDANAYLLMKNFIKHAIYEKYRHDPRHVLINGGMTTLRAWLSTEGTKL